MTANRKSVGCGCFALSMVLGTLFFVSVVFNREFYLYEAPLHLAFGWILHGYLSIENLASSWPWLLQLIAWLAVTTMALHGVSRFIRTLRFSQSLAIVTATLSLFAATCASIAIVHQLGWLSQANLVQDTGRGRITRSINNARQLILACQLYAGDANGEYPPTLDTLLEANILTDLEKLRNAIQPDETLVPFTYLHGLSPSDAAELPLIVSSGPVHADKYIVGKNDGSVTVESAESYRRFLDAYREFMVKKGHNQ